jgi:hypothetical protein
MLKTINALAAFLTLFGIFLVAWFDYQAWEMKRHSLGRVGDAKMARPVLRGSTMPFPAMAEITPPSPIADQKVERGPNAGAPVFIIIRP